MALPFSTRLAGPFTLSEGQTGPITADWPLYAAADLLVIREREGERSTLTLGDDYAIVHIVAENGAPIGFQLTLLDGAAAGDKLLLIGSREAANVVTLTSERATTAQSINRALDMCYAQLQEFQRKIDAALSVDPFTGDFDARQIPLRGLQAATAPDHAVNLLQLTESIAAAAIDLANLGAIDSIHPDADLLLVRDATDGVAKRATQMQVLEPAVKAAEIGSLVQAWSAILQGMQESFLTAHKDKLDHLAVTAATDLDAIRVRVAELDAAVVLVGSWDASTGVFPGGGTARAGESWIVSASGDVDGVDFVTNDRIVAVADNASTSSYAGQWHKLDYTDQVLSVAGRTGAVTLAAADITDATANGRSLITSANYAAMRTLLDLVVGTNVQAQNSKLQDIASATFGDGEVPVWNNATGHFEPGAGGGEGGGAPTDVEYLVRTTNATLTGERLVMDSESIAADWGASGEVRFHVRAYGHLMTSVGHNAMLLATLSGFAHFPSANSMADSFNALTYVDVAGATNLDTSAPGILKGALLPETVIPRAEGGIISDGFNVRVNAAFDGNGNQDRDAGAVSSGVRSVARIGKDYGGAPKYVTGMALWGMNDAGYINSNVATVTLTLKASNTDPTSTGWAGTTIGAMAPFTNVYSINPKATLGNVNTTAYRYVWYEISGSVSAFVYLAECEFYERLPGTSNLTVATAALPLAVEPDVMRGLVLVHEVESATPNTDYDYAFSRDDGANWVSAPLTLIREVPIAGGITLKLYGTGDVDVSGQTYVAPRARYRTLTGKMVPWHAHYVDGMVMQ